MGRLTDLTHTNLYADPDETIADYDYVYDLGSRMTDLTLDHVVNQFDRDTHYTLDDVNQLLGAEYDTGPDDEDFTYDDNGNRTDGSFQTGGDNRLAEDGTFTYLYDDEGNCISKTRISTDPADDWRTEYTWDHRNRLTRVVVKNRSGAFMDVFEYSYDYLNRRIRKADYLDFTDERYEYQIPRGDNAVATITDADGLAGTGSAPALAAVNLYGAAVDEILAVDDGSDVQWGLADHEGSIRDIVDDTGDLVEHRDYTAYGEISRFNPDGTPDTAALDFVFAFTGREWDNDIHLANHRARWYDPHAARFINQDPSGFAGGDSSRGKKAAKPLRTPPRAAGATLEIGLCGLNRLEYGHPPVSV